MNQSKINTLKWTGKDQLVSLGDSVYIRVRKSSKTYLIRKMINGKNSVTKLGKHPVMNLKDARRAAVLAEVERERVTISKVIDQYLNEQVYDKSKVVKQVEGYLRYIDREIGRKFVSDADTRTLVDLIQGYKGRKHPRAADRLRSYLKALFGYAVELGHIDSNPMVGVTKRVTGYEQIDRERTLTSDEIRMVWSWRNPDKGWQKTEDNARVIKFLLLTGLRISEAQSGYIDRDKFRIADTKGKHSKHKPRPHWVHLTDDARALLPLPECTPTNIQAWLRRRLDDEGITDRFTPHDCRRTFATLANSNDVQPFIVERALNHRMPGVMAIYNRAEYEAERIECAEIVDTVIQGIVTGAES
jgi:integrase